MQRPVRLLLAALCLALLCSANWAQAKQGSSLTVSTTVQVSGTILEGAITLTNTGTKRLTIASLSSAVEVRFPSDYVLPSLPPGSSSDWFLVLTQSLTPPPFIAPLSTVTVPYFIDLCDPAVADYTGAKYMRVVGKATLSTGTSQLARTTNFVPPSQDDCPVCGDGIVEGEEECDGGTCCTDTCQALENGTSCSDSNACTHTDQCQSGLCVGSDPVTCTASDQCHAVGTCNPTTGTCSNPPRANGTACNDSNVCTRTDSCQAGVCTGGNPVLCTASDQCHAVGTCDAQTGTCSNPVKADGAACNDGDGCTEGDSCVGGVCQNGTPRDCNDHQSCTTDACVSATGACSYQSSQSCASCDAGECLTCQAGCTGQSTQCAENCWAGFVSCLDGCTSTYCAPFCQVDLGACLNTCPTEAACHSACEAGNGCTVGCTQP